MTDPKLKPLYKEVSFWVMVAMSVPGIASTYVAAYDGVRTGSFDPGAFQSAFLALPIVAYLLARQYPRGKAAEAVGVQLAAQATAAPDTELALDRIASAVQAATEPETAAEPDDGFGESSEDPTVRAFLAERHDARAEG